MTLQKDKLNVKQKLMLKNLEASLGVITIAAKKTGITPKTHYDWLASIPAYKKAAEDVVLSTGDFVENKLHQLINNGNVAATIFYCKTKLKNRGYIETIENNMSIDAIRIRYVVPTEEQQLLDRPQDTILLPEQNNTISLDIPE